VLCRTWPKIGSRLAIIAINGANVVHLSNFHILICLNFSSLTLLRTQIHTTISFITTSMIKCHVDVYHLL